MDAIVAAECAFVSRLFLLRVMKRARTPIAADEAPIPADKLMLCEPPVSMSETPITARVTHPSRSFGGNRRFIGGNRRFQRFGPASLPAASLPNRAALHEDRVAVAGVEGPCAEGVEARGRRSAARCARSARPRGGCGPARAGCARRSARCRRQRRRHRGGRGCEARRRAAHRLAIAAASPSDSAFSRSMASWRSASASSRYMHSRSSDRVSVGRRPAAPARSTPAPRLRAAPAVPPPPISWLLSWVHSRLRARFRPRTGSTAPRPPRLLRRVAHPRGDGGETWARSHLCRRSSVAQTVRR